LQGRRLHIEKTKRGKRTTTTAEEKGGERFSIMKNTPIKKKTRKRNILHQLAAVSQKGKMKERLSRKERQSPSERRNVLGPDAETHSIRWVARLKQGGGWGGGRRFSEKSRLRARKVNPGKPYPCEPDASVVGPGRKSVSAGKKGGVAAHGTHRVP